MSCLQVNLGPISEHIVLYASTSPNWHFNALHSSNSLPCVVDAYVMESPTPLVLLKSPLESNLHLGDCC